MNKKISFAFGLLIFVVITGCGGGFGGRDTPITDVDIRTGTDGLVMEFLENAPPKNVFEDGQFPISLKLKNSGAFDIKDDEDSPEFEGGFVVFGFEKAYVDVPYPEIRRVFVDLDQDGKDALKDELTIALGNYLVEGYSEVGDDANSEIDIVSDAFLAAFYVSENYPEQNRVNVDNLINYLRDPNNDGDYDDSRLNEDLETEVVDFLEDYQTGLIEPIKEDILKEEINIQGKSIYIPKGDEGFVNLNAKAGKISGQSEKHPSTIFATACYPYETVLGTSVCVDTDIFGERRGEKACAIKNQVFGEGQGAPVAVTKIETRMLPQDGGKIKPHFLIHVRNMGDGQVVDRNKIKYACNSSALSYTDLNNVTIDAQLSGIQLKCSENEDEDPGHTTVRLKDKEDVIRCTYHEDGGIDASIEAYAAPLRVELNYGYTFTISKNIIIEKVLTY
tara:strand:- start:2632 stop:3972 length:1341 start_codon:yes stop_codon:yes gene_type:complete